MVISPDFKLSYGSVNLNSDDLKILSNDEWFNDKLLTFIGEFAMESANRVQTKLMHVFTPPETEVIRHSTLQEVDIFFRTLGVDQFSMVAFIVSDNSQVDVANGGSHWSLLVFDRAKDTFRHFDSIVGSNHIVALRLMHQAHHLVGQKNRQMVLKAENVLQQKNSRDCGLMVAGFLWKLAEMITPVFWITEENDHLLIRIRAPHGNLSELDYDHGENMFVFTCPPYFLRLHFKQMVQEYGSAKAKFEWKSEEGEFHIRVPKLHKEEHFTNLDMITELLNPTPESHGRQLVEEVGEDEDESEDNSNGDEFLMHQEISPENEASRSEIQKFGYGFGWSKMGVIERLRDSIGKLVDLQNPEEVKIEDRQNRCASANYEDFDEERYLADTLDPEEELISIIASAFAQKVKLSDQDREKLKDISKKSTKASMSNSLICFSLVDIVFAYCYDQRVNEWESTCESGWTIAKLAPSLSYFTLFKSVREALIVSAQRAITYPLYRSYELAEKVISDVRTVFSQGGRSGLLHILCDIHSIFATSGDFRYILNDLFISDYIIWIQSVPDDVLLEVTKQLDDTITNNLKKSELEWDLDVLEAEAKLQRTCLDSDDEPDQ